MPAPGRFLFQKSHEYKLNMRGNCSLSIMDVEGMISKREKKVALSNNKNSDDEDDDHEDKSKIALELIILISRTQNKFFKRERQN